MRALILAPFDPRCIATLGRSLDVTHESWLETRRLADPDRLGLRLGEENTSILVVESDFVFEEVFDQAEGLKLVGVCRNSTHQIDVEAATRHGVLVVNTPGRNARAVAEHVLGLMLALARRIPEAHEYVRDKCWRNPAEPYITMRGVELAGRTLGIVGLGAIGATLADIGSALGMKVSAHDPYVTRPPDGIALLELDALMASSDFVCVHVPATPETEGLIDARRLSLMRTTAYLVNASDPSVADQAALVGVLRQRRINGAAFDVFDSHPVSPTNPLLELDNVVLSPHLGGATEETIGRHSQLMTDDILRFLKGRRPRHLVNEEAWERRGR